MAYRPYRRHQQRHLTRLRHLAFLCDHANIAPRSNFPLPPSPSTWLPSIWNEPWCPPPFVRPGRWVLRDLLVWFSISTFPLLRHVVTPCLRDSPRRALLGDDRYLFPSHELAFLVPDQGDVSEAAGLGLSSHPLNLTTTYCPPVNVLVSRRAAGDGLHPSVFRLSLHGPTVGAGHNGTVPRHAPDKVKRETRNHGKACLPVRIDGRFFF